MGSPHCVILLAQSDSAVKAGRLFESVLPWLGVFVVVIVLGGVAVALIRRALRRNETAADTFSLQALRDLHASGQLSDEEFERARTAVIGRTRAARPDKPPSQSEGSDHSSRRNGGDSPSSR